MNFYPHFLGDYQRDTAHLTLIEHGAYRVLLDTYYATEKALPSEPPALYRICKAFTAAERRAVDMVSKHFFPVGAADGLRHNARADEEIAKAASFARSQAKRARKGWDKRRNDAGVMPGHMPDGCRNDAGVMPGGCPEDANHNHNHNHKKNKSTAAGRPAMPQGFEDFWGTFPHRAGGNPKPRAAKAYRARIAEGHTPEEMLEGVRRYAEFVRATGKEGTEYVLQAATFLGPDKRFLEPWASPGASNVAPLYRREGVM